MSKISVLMPVYNVKKYLKQSLDSLLNQSYKDYEIICVDDGSTDGSGEMLDDYARRYDCIKVKHKVNTGYGNSMNVAASLAKGEYLAILEPDDFLENDCFKEIISVFEKNRDVDFVKCDYWEYKNQSSTYVRIVEKRNLYNRIISGEEKNELLLANHIAHWSAIYKIEFVEKNKLFYNETPGASYQDLGFWFLSTLYASKIYLFDKAFYHYRCDNPTSSMNNQAKVDCSMKEYDFILEKALKYCNINEFAPYYTRCRTAAVIDTYKRIAEKYRADYLRSVHDDFSRLLKDGILNSDRLSNEEMVVYRALLEEPGLVCDRKKSELMRFHKAISSHDTLFIYGAGNIALFIYRLMKEEERKKIAAFVVTTIKQEIEIDHIPVTEFLKKIDKNALYIVSVSERYRDEVIDNMIANDINDIFCFEV